MKIKKMKNKHKYNLIIFIVILVILAFIRIRIIRINSREITYSVERYVTSGIFNRNKLHHVNNFHITFSDGKIAVVQVIGPQKKSPYKKVKYDVLVEKNSKGIWKVKKLYQIPES
ncbi:hypothetical protein KQI86_15410 [Clostridium sp. MSJ-11]|uniref:Uncharacterized protein n=1 Tax=Clostridium mobile TaxID=2841512 RepID=A0ABS6ELP4_9CLOT|nr:hypothetical protein [Clostridium mobile]MBU5485707.1 hypothetical protein [Clostridium mobile]